MFIYGASPFYISCKSDFMVHPIWKDFYVNLGTADSSIMFRILADNEEIYLGRAYRRPGESGISVRINDICADYMINIFPNLEQASADRHRKVVFSVQIVLSDVGLWDTIQEVEFINDWSYDYAYDPATMGMAFPVNGILDRRQWVVFTEYEAASIIAHLEFADGSGTMVEFPVQISPDFNADFNTDFAKSIRGAQTATAVFDLSEWQDLVSVTIGNNKFKVVNTCSRYVLYYLNAHGGWDSLLIEGNHSEVDNLTRHTREVEYDNRSVQNRGVHNYVNEITKSLTLHTSWLSDEEAGRMHHLLNSTNVYLGDLETGEMIPVILQDTATEYKTYKGNGGKLVNYAIRVAYANDRVRR